MHTVTLSEAKARLPRLLREAEELGEQLVITRSGKPAAVLMPMDEYEGLMETLDILADDDLVRAIRRGLHELARGESVSHEDLWGGLDDPL